MTTDRDWIVLNRKVDFTSVYSCDSLGRDLLSDALFNIL